jgi:P-type conjugative transfer protein TrbJ
MKHRTLKLALLAATGLAVLAMTAPGASAVTVFDPWNYKENLLTAVRSLEEINNQVKQLANEARMLLKMDLNLEQLGSSIGGDIKGSLGEMEALLKKADGLALTVAETETEVKRLFPSEYKAALSGDESLKLAKDRWDEALAAFKRTMALEAKVTETSATDGDALSDLLSKSESAVGNLQAQQAGNELLGLNVKQQLQLLTLIATEQRASSLDRARAIAGQEEARLRFQSFLGDGSAYTR